MYIMALRIMTPSCSSSRQFWRLATNQMQKARRYKEERIVGYSAEQMFDIVNSVSQYPYFVPWCKQVTTYKVTDRVAEYELRVGFPPLKERYTSRVTVLYPTVVHAICTEGRLFDVFDTTWRFGPGPGGLLQKDACTIIFTLEFQFKSAMYASLSGMVFNQIVSKMVNAFLKRAEHIHGPSSFCPETLNDSAIPATSRRQQLIYGQNLKLESNRGSPC